MKFLVKEHLSQRYFIINLVFVSALIVVALAIFVILLPTAPFDVERGNWLQQPLRHQLILLMPLLFVFWLAHQHWISFHAELPVASQVQEVSLSRHIWSYSIAFFVLVSPALLFNLWVPYFAHNDGLSLFTPKLIAALAFGNFFLMWWLIPLKSLIPYAKTYWRHVMITGRFDQPAYYPGEEICFKVSSRTAIVNDGIYQLHFQYVNEPWVSAKRRSRKERTFHHSESRTIRPAPLADQGVRFTVPVEAFMQDWANRLDNTEDPAYWEILLEEKTLAGNFVVGRFIVPIVVS